MSGLYIAISAILVGFLLPAESRIAVDDLKHQIASRVAAHADDEDLARRLGGIELSERLTTQSLDEILANPSLGPKTKQAIELLFDSSAFLNPPSSELPRKPRPNAAEQQEMLSSAANFVSITLRHLPDFLAMRVTKSFDNSAMFVTPVGPAKTEFQYAGTFYQQITYRNGEEVKTEPSVTDSEAEEEQNGTVPGLASKGEFGPVLAMILGDSSMGSVSWSHWEQTPNGLAGVFNYEVPESASHFAVNFCCVVRRNYPSEAYHGTPAYRGSLSIDPATGTILRLTADARLKAHAPITRSAMSVSYGPIYLNGERYICPVRGVTLSLENTGHYTILRINQVRFTDYRRFASTHRIMPIYPQPQ